MAILSPFLCNGNVIIDGRNAIKWDVDPGYIFFHLKRKGIQAHREGICPSIHVANDKNCISTINNNITIAQKR